MRGAPVITSCAAFCGRIIPADAGSTIRPSPVSKPTWDHPRGCGEHASLTSWSPSPHGSSPRMRGAQTGLSSDEQALGIIPADAGSTDDFSRALDPPEDHPRGCGEHTQASMRPPMTRGSSPRMRGAPDFEQYYSDPTRIIPADAGSTTTTIRMQPSEKDHPRGCGEHDGEIVHVPCRPGSSPRMRGAQRTATRPEDCRGIIPADAGSTHQ